jgi:hypothetical protein
MLGSRQAADGGDNTRQLRRFYYPINGDRDRHLLRQKIVLFTEVTNPSSKDKGFSCVELKRDV